MNEIAIIGIGHIGSILAQRICLAIAPERVIVYDRNPEKMDQIAQQTGCKKAEGLHHAVREARYVIFAVKPQSFAALLRAALPAMQETQCLISTAAGVDIRSIETVLAEFDRTTPVIRIMPNLVISIGKGSILLSKSEKVSDEQVNELKHALSECGVCQNVDEDHFSMGVSLNSCTPAYVFMMLEALADGGVSLGYSRIEAEEIAAQTVMGAAMLYLETHQSLGALKDAVCSPDGAAISGIRALEKGRFRGSLINAVEAAYQKNESLNFGTL